MSLVDANHAIEAFLDAISEAQAMAAAGGQVGVEFDYLLRHAEELLDLVDEGISKADPAGQRYLIVSAAVLRERLEHLRDEQPSGTAHCDRSRAARRPSHVDALCVELRGTFGRVCNPATRPLFATARRLASSAL